MFSAISFRVYLFDRIGEPSAARLLQGAVLSVGGGETRDGTACGRACSTNRWFRRKAVSHAEYTSLTDHTRVKVGVVSVDVLPCE